MHHTNFLKRCLTQPRLFLRTFLLGMLLTGCFAVMANFGASMASAQSLAEQNRPHGQSNRDNHERRNSRNQGDDTDQGNPKNQGDDKGQASPTSEASPTSQGKNVPAESNKNNTTGSLTNATGSTNSSSSYPVGGAPVVGAVPVGGVPAGGVPNGGVGGPGLPFAGSDPGNNPLP